MTLTHSGHSLVLITCQVPILCTLRKSTLTMTLRTEQGTEAQRSYQSFPGHTVKKQEAGCKSMRPEGFQTPPQRQRTGSKRRPAGLMEEESSTASGCPASAALWVTSMLSFGTGPHVWGSHLPPARVGRSARSSIVPRALATNKRTQRREVFQVKYSENFR